MYIITTKEEAEGYTEKHRFTLEQGKITIDNKVVEADTEILKKTGRIETKRAIAWLKGRFMHVTIRGETIYTKRDYKRFTTEYQSNGRKETYILEGDKVTGIIDNVILKTRLPEDITRQLEGMMKKTYQAEIEYGKQRRKTEIQVEAARWGPLLFYVKFVRDQPEMSPFTPDK